MNYFGDEDGEMTTLDAVISDLKSVAKKIDEEVDEDDDDPFQSGRCSMNILDTKDKNESYHLFMPTPLEEGEDPFSEVIGHQNEKDELLRVINWFNHSKELMEKGISIPRGVLLHGRPGTGKTMMMRALIKLCQCPVVVYQGQSSNPSKALMETFMKAKELSHAVILIDELDLVVYRKQEVQRVLQQNMDGIEDKGDILIIAACNDLTMVPNALLRSGRFDRKMHIGSPNLEERIQLFQHFCDEFHLTLPADLDLKGISYSLAAKTGACIKALVNDIVLRYGFENITQEKILTSIECLDGYYGPIYTEKRKNIAIHEAAHCIMAMKYPQYFIIDRLNINSTGGKFMGPVVDEDNYDYNILLANIETSMAGNLAEKMFFSTGSVGCIDDLEKARCDAYELVNRVGYRSCWRTLPVVDDTRRQASQKKTRNNERLIESILRKCERRAKWYLRRHKKEIEALGNLLYDKSHLNQKQIMECVKGVRR